MPSQENAFEIQNEISSIYNSRIVPVLDEICQQFSAKDSVIKLDKLEIDLGSVSLENLEEELVEKPRKHFREALSNLVRQAELDPGSTVNKISRSTSKLELLDYFLQTGTLPWWADRSAVSDLEGIFRELIKQSPEEIKALIIRGTQDEDFRLRLIYQFSESLLSDMVRLLEPQFADFILDISDDLQRIHKTVPFSILDDLEFSQLLWDSVLLYVTDKDRSFKDEKSFVEYLFQKITAKDEVSYEVFILSISENISKLTKTGMLLNSPLLGLIEQLKEDVIISGKTHEKKPEAKRKYEDVKKPPVQKSKVESIIDDEQPEQLLADREEQVSEIYIENAGLVLLWQFLPGFFKRLKFIEDNKFTGKKTAHKAAHLLQYLVTGKVENPEYLMVINKILCGLDVSEPVNKGFRISKTQKSEAISLVKSAIKNWSILKKTSVDGFREAFLQRAGVLKRQDNGWLLQVERKSYDIILEKLPWSISIIKLPWMKEIIHVEW